MKLKSLGKEFLDQLNEMNRFYLNEFVEVEKETRIYSGGILYNLFLLTATNYKELAESNIKKLRKTSDLNERNSYKMSILKVSLNGDKMGLIENMNNNCVKLIGSTHTKVDYIGKPMFSICPTPYVQ